MMDLSHRDPEKMEFIHIPEGKDLSTRLRFIKDILEQWDQDASVAIVRMQNSSLKIASPSPQMHTNESIYLPNGKLNVPYLIQNANLLFAAGEYSLSKNIFKTLLQSGEKAAQIHLGLGQCLEAENKLEDARKHYEESITFQGTVEAYRALGNLLIRLKRDLAAADVFERALSLKDLTVKTRFELHKASGNAWTRCHRKTEAEAHYKKALTLDPLADEIKTNLGALYLQIGQGNEARRYFEAALTTNPKSAAARMGLAILAMNQGDKRAAHDLFAKSLDIELQNATAIYYLVKCAYEIRSYAVAARIVEQYTQVAPVNINLLYSLAGLQFHLGRLKEARETIRRILKISPEHTASKELLGLIIKYESASH